MGGSLARRFRNAAPALMGALAATFLLLVVAALLVRTRPVAVETPEAGIVLKPSTPLKSGENISQRELDDFLSGLAALSKNSHQKSAVEPSTTPPEAVPETPPVAPEVVEPSSREEPEPPTPDETKPDLEPVFEKQPDRPKREPPGTAETHPLERETPPIEPDPVKVEKEPIKPPEPVKPHTPPPAKPKVEKIKAPPARPVAKIKKARRKPAASKPKRTGGAPPENRKPQKPTTTPNAAGSNTKKTVEKVNKQTHSGAGDSKPGNDAAKGEARTGKKTGGGPSGSDTRPVAVNAPRPSYPRSARKRGIEGWVKVRFQVDSSGKVLNPSVVRASPAGVFEKTVLKTLPRWRFRPGTSSGRPMTAWVVTTIRFQLVD